MPGVFQEMDGGGGEPDLRGRLSNLLLSDSMSDVVFAVDDPPHRFPCHKLILGLGSRVFEAMFYGKMAEGTEVRVPDVTKTGFTTMLRYLYTDTIHINSQSEAFEAAYVAQKYLIDPLFRACETYLVLHVPLDPQTVLPVHEEATLLDMRRLRDRCMRYVSRNSRKVLASRSFACASRSTLEDILALDLMDVDSEVDVMQALWRWGQQRCQELDIECSGKNVRNATRDFLRLVRFLSLSKVQLERALERFQMLDSEEELAVLFNVAMSGRAKLLSNLCDVSRTRSVANCSRLELPTEYRYDGSLTVFSTRRHRTTVRVTVTGSRVTLLGAVLAFKPIPCYSPVHRSVDLEMRVGNASTRLRSAARLSRKAAEDEDEERKIENAAENGERVRDEDEGRLSSQSPVDEERLHEKADDEEVRRLSAKAEDEGRLSTGKEDGEWLEDEMELLLEDYVVVSDGETADVSVEVEAEGVRLMQCVEEEFTCRCGEAMVSFRFDPVDRRLFPIKELMCVVTDS